MGRLPKTDLCTPRFGLLVALASSAAAVCSEAVRELPSSGSPQQLHLFVRHAFSVCECIPVTLIPVVPFDMFAVWSVL